MQNYNTLRVMRNLRTLYFKHPLVQDLAKQEPEMVIAKDVHVHIGRSNLPS